MHRLFGVARDYDGGRLARVDVLHSLYLSARLRQPAEAVGAAILEEVVGLTDQAGGGALARRVTPEPADPDRPLLVPLVSLVGAIGRPRPKLLGLVATATGCQPGDVAFEIGIKHLTAWSDLWLGYGTMVTMPHAQNAHIELRPTNTFGRVVFHDMRDVDVWDRYASASSRDTRLMAVDRHYLRFEMTAHPVYHDARAWRDPRVRLAASLFSFSFQMLWHYVLFPLVVGVAASEQAAARRLESAFTSAVWALGRGQRPPVGMEDCERPTVGRRRAARQLRDLWLAKALAGGGAFEA